MIKPEQRFFLDSMQYFGTGHDPTDIAHAMVFDWDQLRMVKVKSTAKLFPFEGQAEVPAFARIADFLSPGVHAVTLDDDGLIVDVSTEQEQDDSAFIAYFPFSSVESLAGCRTIQHSRLKEIDRLGPGVDLSVYEDDSGFFHKVAFKFNVTAKPKWEMMAWNELHLLKSLPPHPNIVPFDRVVIEDVQSRVIGFTTKYIPGGTFQDDPQKLFRFEWLQQLTQLIDFLNLEMQITHQDIAPRNLLVDTGAQKLILFDFNYVARGEGVLDGRDDVTGVVYTLYELITNSNSFAREPHWERNIDKVLALDWPCDRPLDSDVSTFRGFLNEWVAKRKRDKCRHFDVSTRLTWPDIPTVPDYDVPFRYGTCENGEPRMMTGRRTKSIATELGQYCFRWNRPPQKRLLVRAEDAGR